jgi:hypothetical protein
VQNLKDFLVVIVSVWIIVYLFTDLPDYISTIYNFVVSFSPLAWFIISVIVFIAAAYLMELLGLNEDQAGFIGYLIWAPIICLAISFMHGFDEEIKVENANQLTLWHADAANFLQEQEQKKIDFERKQIDRITQLAPALTDAISEIEQNIKEDELRLFALKDVLIDYFNEVGQSDAALNRQYNSAGIYWGTRIGITLDDKCVVTQVSAGSVAERLHIEPGDKVIMIGESENNDPNSCLPNRGQLEGYWPESFCCIVGFVIKPVKRKTKLPYGFVMGESREIYGAKTILSVTAGSQAEKAGIKEGDIIVGIDFKKPKSTNSINYYLADLHQSEKPKTVLNILRNNQPTEITFFNRYGEGERSFYVAVENQPYFKDKDYAKLVNSINAKYSLLRFYKNKANNLYWEDKRAQLTSNNNQEDLSIMIQEAEKMVERNRDLITIN